MEVNELPKLESCLDNDSDEIENRDTTHSEAIPVKQDVVSKGQLMLTNPSRLKGDASISVSMGGIGYDFLDGEELKRYQEFNAKLEDNYLDVSHRMAAYAYFSQEKKQCRERGEELPFFTGQHPGRVGYVSASMEKILGVYGDWLLIGSQGVNRLQVNENNDETRIYLLPEGLFCYLMREASKRQDMQDIPHRWSFDDLSSLKYKIRLGSHPDKKHGAESALDTYNFQYVLRDYNHLLGRMRTIKPEKVLLWVNPYHDYIEESILKAHEVEELKGYLSKDCFDVYGLCKYKLMLIEAIARVQHGQIGSLHDYNSKSNDQYKTWKKIAQSIPSLGAANSICNRYIEKMKVSLRVAMAVQKNNALELKIEAMQSELKALESQSKLVPQSNQNNEDTKKSPIDGNNSNVSVSNQTHDFQDVKANLQEQLSEDPNTKEQQMGVLGRLLFHWSELRANVTKIFSPSRKEDEDKPERNRFQTQQVPSTRLVTQHELENKSNQNDAGLARSVVSQDSPKVDGRSKPNFEVDQEDNSSKDEATKSQSRHSCRIL